MRPYNNINTVFAALCLALSYNFSYMFLCFIYDSGIPSGVNYSEVRAGLLEVKGVTAVHNLYIWALTMNQAVMTAHVAIGERKLPGSNVKTKAVCTI